MYRKFAKVIQFLSFNGYFSHQQMQPLETSFLTEQFDPGHWPIRLLYLACHWPTFGLFCLISHTPYCISWFILLHICITLITLSPLTKSDIQQLAKARWLNDYRGHMFYCCGVWLFQYDRVVTVLLSWSYVFLVLNFRVLIIWVFLSSEKMDAI